MSDRITRADMDCALENHKLALTACGITYTGELFYSWGSKRYGNAFRLFRTYVPLTDTQLGNDRVPYLRNGVAVCTGHYSPPIGGDYLGMTPHDAYDRLTDRTAVLWDLHRIVVNVVNIPFAIPDDYPVRELVPGTEEFQNATDLVTCGTCYRSWDDAVATAMTPAPSARCPFESYH